MNQNQPTVLIEEDFTDYRPPINVFAVTSKLLDNIPEKYILGLRRVVFTNMSGLPHRETRRKVTTRHRKISVNTVRGFYHHRSGTTPAWIEIYIDQIDKLKVFLYRMIPFLRELAVGEVLFHELGHHIHATISPEYGEREDIADRWGRALLKGFYFRKAYWFLTPLWWVMDKLESFKWFPKVPWIYFGAYLLVLFFIDVFYLSIQSPLYAFQNIASGEPVFFRPSSAWGILGEVVIILLSLQAFFLVKDLLRVLNSELSEGSWKDKYVILMHILFMVIFGCAFCIGMLFQAYSLPFIDPSWIGYVIIGLLVLGKVSTYCLMIAFLLPSVWPGIKRLLARGK